MSTDNSPGTPDAEPRFRRIVLKLSGEALADDSGKGIDADRCEIIARQVREIVDLGVQTAIVIGGGNIIRGQEASRGGLDRAHADTMGMLATVINGLALQDVLERAGGLPTRMMTAIEMRTVAEPYIRRRALRHLEKGRVVLLAGGTGSPFFTTDTTAALRASEIGADAILKATKVDGVYDRDPMRFPGAKRYEKITYSEALSRRLRVMDATAFAMCMDQSIPIIVFDFFRSGNLRRVVLGEPVGTLVVAEKTASSPGEGPAE